jgi:isoquinoline 1-oxidoreductase beta subunit
MTYHRNQQNLVIANVSRRGLLKGAAGSGLFVLAAQFPAVRSAMAYATGADKMQHGVVTNPHIFVSIDKDGTVSIVAARAEMGTGAARTTLPMIVADELDADWARVRVVQSPGDEETYGNQDTDGSRSVRHFIQPMRQVGAGARQMLETAAAKRWNVPVSEVKASLHEVVHTPSGKKLGYGELAADAAALPAPALDTLRLKEPSAFRYIGKGNVQIVDLFDITTGNTTYGQDVKLPGLKFAVVARSPVVGGKVASYDAAATMKVPGVVKVVAIDGTPAPAAFAPKAGIAVIANNTWAALKGRDALKIVWDDGPNGSFDSVAYKAMLEKNVRKPGKVERNEGDVDSALGSATQVMAEYYSPHFAHAPMEPPSATARQGDIWTSVQSPGRPCRPKNVTLHETLLGGGFGHKSKWDFAIEAVLLSRRWKARRSRWSGPQDDIQHGFYHVTAERPRPASTRIKVVAAPQRVSARVGLGMGFVGTLRSTCQMSGWRAARRSRMCAAGSDRSTTWAVDPFVADCRVSTAIKGLPARAIGPARSWMLATAGGTT